MTLRHPGSCYKEQYYKGTTLNEVCGGRMCLERSDSALTEFWHYDITGYIPDNLSIFCHYERIRKREICFSCGRKISTHIMRGNTQ